MAWRAVLMTAEGNRTALSFFGPPAVPVKQNPILGKRIRVAGLPSFAPGLW